LNDNDKRDSGNANSTVSNKPSKKTKIFRDNDG
jgi:hypothetical protein